MRKILTPDEEQAVLQASDPDQYLWALWASKESAYKAISKSYPEVTAAPKRYAVFLAYKPSSIILNGIVHSPKGMVRVRLFLNEEYIHCIGIYNCYQDLNDIFWCIGKMLPYESAAGTLSAGSQSIMVRQMAAKSIAQQLKLNPKQIQIKRKNSSKGLGPPMVYINGNKSKIDVSLSHHGRFGAYVFWNLKNSPCSIKQ